MATLAGVRIRRIGGLVNHRWTDTPDGVIHDLICAATRALVTRTTRR